MRKLKGRGPRAELIVFALGAIGFGASLVALFVGRGPDAAIAVCSAVLLAFAVLREPIADLIGRVRSATVKAGGSEYSVMLAASLEVLQATPDTPAEGEARERLQLAVAAAIIPGFQVSYLREGTSPLPGFAFEVRVPLRWNLPSELPPGQWDLSGLVSGPNGFVYRIGVDYIMVWQDGSFGALLELPGPGAFDIDWVLAAGETRIVVRRDRITVTGAERMGDIIRSRSLDA